MRADGGTRDIASAAADDRGSVLILGVGLTAVVLALLMVVMDVVAVALRQHDADLVADAAARAAAQAVDPARYYRSGSTARVPLDPVAARGRARDFVSRSGTWSLGSVTVTGDVVTVTVTTDLPLPASGWWSGRVITVRGAGAAELRRQ